MKNHEGQLRDKRKRKIHKSRRRQRDRECLHQFLDWKLNTLLPGRWVIID